VPGFERKQLVEKFQDMKRRRIPIVGGGAGTGLSAKCEEAGGIDLIVIYNSGRYRMAGRGSLAGLIALLLGVPMGRLLVRGMNEVAGISAPYIVPWHAIIAAPLLAIVVGVLAALVPGMRIARIRPAEAVRFE